MKRLTQQLKTYRIQYHPISQEETQVLYTGLIEGMETDTAVPCSEFSMFLHKINSDKMQSTLLEQYQVFHITLLNNFFAFIFNAAALSREKDLTRCESVLYFYWLK